MQSVESEITVTADTPDALNGTDLERAPGPGAIGIWLASTVADSRATVLVAQKGLKTDSLIGKVATNAQIAVNEDPPLMADVVGGEKLRVSLDIVSAGTIRIKAIWLGVVA